MLDDLGIAWEIEEPKEFQDRVKKSFNYCQQLWDPHFQKGEVTHYKAKLNNLRLIMSDQGIKLFGSFHKYLKGENFSSFDHSELRMAIIQIAKVFGDEFLHGKITNITPSVNLPLYAKEIIDRILLIKGKPVRPMLGGSTHLVYGAYIKGVYERYKLYDKQLEVRIHSQQKSPPQLRIEKEYNLMRANRARTRNIINLTPEDLFHDSIKDFLYSELHDFIASLHFKEGLKPSQAKTRKQLMSLAICSSKENLESFKNLADSRTLESYLKEYQGMMSAHSNFDFRNRLIKSLDETFLKL